MNASYADAGVNVKCEENRMHDEESRLFRLIHDRLEDWRFIDLSIIIRSH